MSSYISYELNRKLQEIAFLSLWDECLIIAWELSSDRQVPEEVKLDASIFDEKEWLSRSENKTFWKELQTWVSQLICKSIDNGEVKALYVGRGIEGSINPENTFVHRDELDKWMWARDLERGEPTFIMQEETSSAFSEMESAVETYAYILTDYLYEPFQDWKNGGRSKKDFAYENRYLKDKVDKLEQLQKSVKPPNKHQERHAVKREEVLGAAMSVIAQWSDQCRNNLGKVEATKVRVLIEEKAPLFWRSTGEPPLSSDVIERLVREWLKKTGD